MALIHCVDCGTRFSDKAKACISCGCPTYYMVTPPAGRRAASPESKTTSSPWSGLEPQRILALWRDISNLKKVAFACLLLFFILPFDYNLTQTVSGNNWRWDYRENGLATLGLVAVGLVVNVWAVSCVLPGFRVIQQPHVRKMLGLLLLVVMVPLDLFMLGTLFFVKFESLMSGASFFMAIYFALFLVTRWAIVETRQLGEEVWRKVSNIG